VTKMEKDEIIREVISVCDDAAKTIPDWIGGLYDMELPHLQSAVQQLKSLKEAAIRRQGNARQ